MPLIAAFPSRGPAQIIPYKAACDGAGLDIDANLAQPKISNRFERGGSLFLGRIAAALRNVRLPPKADLGRCAGLILRTGVTNQPPIKVGTNKAYLHLSVLNSRPSS